MATQSPFKNIDQPSLLLTSFPQHVLTISSKAHANSRWLTNVNDCTLPNDTLLIRYEPDTHMLYVSNQLFKQYKIPEISEKLRRNTQYCGAKTKRLVTGTGLNAPSQHVLIFNLKKVSAFRVETREERSRERLRPEDHADRSLDIIKHGETVFDRACRAHKQVQARYNAVAKEINDPANANASKEWLEHKKEMRSLLEQSMFILDIGKNLHAEVVALAHSYTAPLRRTSRRVKRYSPYNLPGAERTRILAFEAMLKSEAKLIHREVFYWGEKDGRFGEYKREYIPAEGAEYISAYYKEWSRSDGTGLQKILWVPVALLNTYTHKESTLLTPEEKEELKYYRTDIRYVSSQVKRIGGKAQRCAKFDMRRTVNPAKEEPAREPEKNPFK